MYRDDSDLKINHDQSLYLPDNKGKFSLTGNKIVDKIKIQ